MGKPLRGEASILIINAFKQADSATSLPGFIRFSIAHRFVLQGRVRHLLGGGGGQFSKNSRSSSQDGQPSGCFQSFTAAKSGLLSTVGPWDLGVGCRTQTARREDHRSHERQLMRRGCSWATRAAAAVAVAAAAVSRAMGTWQVRSCSWCAVIRKTWTGPDGAAKVLFT